MALFIIGDHYNFDPQPYVEIKKLNKRSINIINLLFFSRDKEHEIKLENGQRKCPKLTILLTHYIHYASYIIK